MWVFGVEHPLLIAQVNTGSWVSLSDRQDPVLRAFFLDVRTIRHMLD